jgi:hypothetical protein
MKNITKPNKINAIDHSTINKSYLMRVLVLSLFSMLLIFPLVSKGQDTIYSVWEEYIHKGENYFKVLEFAEDFFSDESKRTNEYGYNEYVKWKVFWADRVYDSNGDATKGNMNLYAQYMNQSYVNPTQLYATHPRTWYPTGPDMYPETTGKQEQVLGKVNCIQPWTFHNSVSQNTETYLYAGSANGGIFSTLFTDPDNVTWNCLTDKMFLYGANSYYFSGLGINDIKTIFSNGAAIEPDNIRIYAAAGKSEFGDVTYPTGILVSLDNGQNWELKTLSSSNDEIPLQILVNPTDATNIFVRTAKSIFRSLNSGNSFEKVYSLPTTLSRVITDMEIANISVNGVSLYFSISGYRSSQQFGKVVFPQVFLMSDANVQNPVPNVTPSCTEIFSPAVFSHHISLATLADNAFMHPYDLYLCYLDDGGVFRIFKGEFSTLPQTSQIFSSTDICLTFQYGVKPILFEAFTKVVGPTEEYFIVGSFTLSHIKTGSNAQCVNNIYYEDNHLEPVSIRIDGNSGLYFMSTNGGVTVGTRTISDWVTQESQLPYIAHQNINGTGLNIAQFMGVGINRVNSSILAGGSMYNGGHYTNEQNEWVNTHYSCFDVNQGDMVYSKVQPNVFLRNRIVIIRFRLVRNYLFNGYPYKHPNQYSYIISYFNVLFQPAYCYGQLQ